MTQKTKTKEKKKTSRPKTKRVMVNLDTETYRLLLHIKADTFLSIRKIITEALSLYSEKLNGKNGRKQQK